MNLKSILVALASLLPGDTVVLEPKVLTIEEIEELTQRDIRMVDVLIENAVGASRRECIKRGLLK